MDEKEIQAFDELAKLSISDDSLGTAGAASSLDKENINVVFIGHVDAGKSTLGGQLLYLTGMVDKRTLEKFEKESKELNRESWYLSWALDTSEEERHKGITVECGRAHFETDKRRFTILDAPGHKNFVPSMISGAAQSDVAVLVISARKGEFETGFEKGGQTREHAMLVKTLGVKRLIVVINKMDEPSVGWAKERWDECIDKLTPFLRQTGFNLKTEVEFIPISGLKGYNIKEPIPQGMCPWYTGPTLLGFLDSMPSIERRLDAPLLMPVSGKYREMGTMVTGKIESGQVKRGQNVLVMPNRHQAEVLGIYIEETEVKSAKSGDNVRLRLKGVEEEDVATGFVVCDPIRPIKAATTFQAQLVILQIKNIIAPGFKAVLHIHTCSEEITIASLEYTIDRKTQEKSSKKPMFVRQNESVVATIECGGTICLEAASDCDPLGRFTLRDEGRTIAVGKVLKVYATDETNAS
ncbi:Sup35p [Paramicrosporidium saccamoebae]|uniref:Eukaryotic peptide chain release factor GTP-binding subunit n=1 Tax=Paramicrosporidium saccamoebae TaxID=1246581 RepID=A0A2H9TI04_9FUNG|nr:Sup35p [Paramicrosporidium saccamoebae]